MIGVLALAFSGMTALSLIQDGWRWFTFGIAFALLGGAVDFLWAAVDRDHWPWVLWFW
jgi:hypothetical protein